MPQNNLYAKFDAIFLRYLTGQHTVGRLGGSYFYYRCTKKRGPCSQKFLQQKDAISQLKELLQKVSIPNEWTDVMLEQVALWEKEDNSSLQVDIHSRKIKLKEIQEKLERLVNAYIDQEIPKETV